MGDLKLVERPQNYTLGPGAQQAIRWARQRVCAGVHVEYVAACNSRQPTCQANVNASNGSRSC